MFSTELAIPFIGMMILTLVVWVTMFITRMGFIAKANIDTEELKTPEQVAEKIPAEASKASHNFKNLFELPVLFYGLCLYLMLSYTVDNTFVICAWLFFVFRVLHSLVHCTYNNVNHRFMAYALSAIALWVMVVRAALNLF